MNREDLVEWFRNAAGVIIFFGIYFGVVLLLFWILKLCKISPHDVGVFVIEITPLVLMVALWASVEKYRRRYHPEYSLPKAFKSYLWRRETIHIPMGRKTASGAGSFRDGGKE